MRESPASALSEHHDSLEARRAEIASKLGALRALMEGRGIEAVTLSTGPNVAWLTAGATTNINESEAQASFSALITARDAFILTDPIEEPRLREEEHLDALGFTFVVEPWHARGRAPHMLRPNLHMATDTAADNISQDLERALAPLRATLLPGEQARLRAGAQRATDIVESVARALRPGMTENEAAALLVAGSRRVGGSAIVTLVGSDDRITYYRHPVPTSKPVERYVMLVLCLRYRGLVTALTRSIYFGEPDGALLHTARAVALIDAEMIAGTESGHTLGSLYALAARLYSEAGQPDAAQEHHQGGVIAYRGREAFASPTSDWPIHIGQAFAWNPSLRGAKSEDTILLTPNGPEILTRSANWPVWTFETSAGPIARPSILTLPA